MCPTSPVSNHGDSGSQMVVVKKTLAATLNAWPEIEILNFGPKRLSPV